MIRKESLVNARAYRMTRPVPRGQSVFAKLGLILGVLILPQFLQFGLMGACFPGGWEGAGRDIEMIQLPKEAQITVANFQFGRITQSTFCSRSRSSGSSARAWQEGGKSSSLTLHGMPTWPGLPEADILKVRALRSFSPDGNILPVAEERGMSLWDPSPGATPWHC